jgi:hypothetical protein
MAKGKNAGFDLFLISFLTLFGEIALIRYIPSNIYLLSFYKNSVLLAVFLGLGTGFMMSREKRNLVEYLPLASLVLICIVIYFNDYLRIDLDYASMDETIWPEFWANTRATGVPVFWVLVFFYLYVAFYFVPFGQETIRAMKSFSPLKAYSINIGGALAGIVAISVLGWLWTTPLLWFAILLVPLLWWSYRYSTRLVFTINIAAVLLSLFIIFSAHSGLEMWSPYSRIRVYPFSSSPGSGFISTTNGNPQVGAMNFDMSYSGPEKALNLESKRIYEIPYTAIKPSTVMVAGAGAGNEVEMALRHGAASVTAIEIDPAFITIGAALHPHRPFTDPRVKVVVDDARAFFHRTRSLYDLVVIGFLDSQYRLSHMSNIRTENFVYTLESMARTKEILAPGGILQLNYNAPNQGMRSRLYSILEKVYGADLVVFVPKDPVSGNISYLAGPGVRGFLHDPPGLKRVSFAPPKKGYGIEAPLPTDDWPFLYLRAKKIPGEYYSMLLAIPLLSVVFIKTVSRSGLGFSPVYFLMGLGFMVLETKSITSFALLFGSTITVVAIVIASILAAILVANLCIHRFALKGSGVPYLLILATLVILYFLPLGYFLNLDWTLKLLVSILLISAPIFFAALIFGISFSRSERMDIDLGSNIFGAVIGGMFEYVSMAAGFKTLYIISFLAYLGAFIIDRRGRG